jgi:hypothetical protein
MESLQSAVSSLQPMLQVFDPFDFLAEVTQRLPDPGEHLIRYYGWYSNLPAPGLRQAGKTRGQRAQRRPAAAAGTGIPARPPSAHEARKGWAAVSGCRPEAVGCSRGGCKQESRRTAHAAKRLQPAVSSLQPDMIEKIPRHCRRGTGSGTIPRLGPRRRRLSRSRAEAQVETQWGERWRPA